jgi:D-beta-D-heptose 7-phosphate kinase/D-beta-D-heptose 1-phosphate adenosyltransferase
VTPEQLATRLAKIGHPRVLVFGDVILDRYVFGSVDRVSPEAPIQVLAVEREELRIGGAGNVARNVAAFGGKARIVGVVGADAQGAELRARLDEITGDASGLLADPVRPTIEKTRMVAHGQQMLRVDRENVRPLDAAQEHRLVEILEGLVPDMRAVVISDYGKGTVTDGIVRFLIETCRKHGVRILVDPKGRDFDRYRGASVITPNRLEAEQVTGLRLDGEQSLVEAGERLVRDLDLEAAVITLGAKGIYLHARDSVPVRVPAEARDVYDVTGAGDTVVAVLAVSLAGGASLEEGVRIANAGAGIVVGKLGTATASRGEIEARLRERTPYFTAKEVTLADLHDHLADARSAGKKIVFTNGCFDLIHAGHISYLAFARSHGDLLVVGVNGDESVRRLKGSGRPIFTLKERVRVLGAIEGIDFIVPFDEATPIDLIEAVRPDVLIKGEDWGDKGVVGREFVEGYGGKVVLAPLVEGQSTTGIVRRIRKLEREGAFGPLVES